MASRLKSPNAAYHFKVADTSSCTSKDQPAFPQPPARALALPTRGAVNMTEVQNWQATKDDRLNPMMHLQTMNEALELTKDIPKTAEEDSSSKNPMAYLGPNLLVKEPRISRAKMVPVICISRPRSIIGLLSTSKGTGQASTETDSQQRDWHRPQPFASSSGPGGCRGSEAQPRRSRKMS